jgi:hypothetical protein
MNSDNSTIDKNTFSFKSSIISEYLMNSHIHEDDAVVLLDAFDVILFPAVRNIGKVTPSLVILCQ